MATARQTLEDATQSNANVRGRDVELLQQLVSKEGEASIALSGIIWNSSNQNEGAAKFQYGTACAWLDELNADYQTQEDERFKRGREPLVKPRGTSLGYSMDDIVGADEASCSRFKNEKIIEEKLVWNEELQRMMKKFLTLSC